MEVVNKDDVVSAADGDNRGSKAPPTSVRGQSRPDIDFFFQAEDGIRDVRT